MSIHQGDFSSNTIPRKNAVPLNYFQPQPGTVNKLRFSNSFGNSVDFSSAAGNFKLERESNVIANFFDRENLTYQQLQNRQLLINSRLNKSSDKHKSNLNGQAGRLSVLDTQDRNKLNFTSNNSRLNTPLLVRKNTSNKPVTKTMALIARSKSSINNNLRDDLKECTTPIIAEKRKPKRICVSQLTSFANQEVED